MSVYDLIYYMFKYTLIFIKMQQLILKIIKLKVLFNIKCFIMYITVLNLQLSVNTNDLFRLWKTLIDGYTFMKKIKVLL